jgi:nitrogen fixation/metabolism regulation signal transduction histidine kinase
MRLIAHPGSLSLRARLTLSFLALALLPSLTVSVMAIVLVGRTASLVGSPGLQHAFDTSVHVAKITVQKLERNLQADGKLLTSGDLLSEVLATGRAEILGQYLRDELVLRNLDFAHYYIEKDGGLEPFALVASSDAPTGIPATFSAEALREARTRPSVLYDSTLVAAFPVVQPDSTRAVLLLGYVLGDELLPQIEAIIDARDYFQELRAYRRVLNRAAALVTLIVIVASVLFARALARSLSRPVDDLVAAMRRVAVGDLEATTTPHGGSEMVYLMESFNRMTQELRRSREQLARAERVAAWSDVARVLSHEIKNSLQPIQMAIPRLRRRLEHLSGADRQAVEDSLDGIREEAESLGKMASTFSEFARLPDPEPTPVDVNGLVRNIAELHASRGPEIRLDLAPDVPPVHTDPSQLRRALDNLVENAIAALWGGGILTLATRPPTERWPHHVSILVSDTGPGIPPEIRDRIFEPYFTTRVTGTGLGLALVDRIVTQNGGRIDVESEPGRGATFTLRLPVAASPAEARGGRS